MAESRTSGYVTLSGAAFDEPLSVLTDELGFELDRIGPADDPRTACYSCDTESSPTAAGFYSQLMSRCCHRIRR